MNNLKLYEKKLKTSYSDFDIEAKDSWALLKYKGKKYNAYIDEKYINKFFTKHIINLNKKKLDIVDLGGGDGVLLDIVGRQLERRGIRANLLNIDNNLKSLLLCNKKFPRIKTKLQNILTIKNRTDVVLSRFVFQYLSKKNQIKLLHVINKILNKGGLLIVVWPYGSDEKTYSRILANIRSIVSGQDVKSLKNSIYYFLPKHFADILKKCGYISVKKEFGGAMMHSVESWKYRFFINENQSKKMDSLYSKYFLKTKKLFYKRKNTIYLKSNVGYVRAFKK
jgi:trans-aconitate methyltransferase